MDPDDERRHALAPERVAARGTSVTPSTPRTAVARIDRCSAARSPAGSGAAISLRSRASRFGLPASPGRSGRRRRLALDRPTPRAPRRGSGRSVVADRRRGVSQAGASIRRAAASRSAGGRLHSGASPPRCPRERCRRLPSSCSPRASAGQPGQPRHRRGVRRRVPRCLPGSPAALRGSGASAAIGCRRGSAGRSARRASTAVAGSCSATGSPSSSSAGSSPGCASSPPWVSIVVAMIATVLLSTIVGILSKRAEAAARRRESRRRRPAPRRHADPNLPRRTSCCRS